MAWHVIQASVPLKLQKENMSQVVCCGLVAVEALLKRLGGRSWTREREMLFPWPWPTDV